MKPRDNPLDHLFQWSHKQLEIIRSTRYERDTEAAARHRAEKQSQSLQIDFDKSERALNQARNENRTLALKHDNEMAKQVMHSSREIDGLRGQIAAMTKSFEEGNRATKQQHESRVNAITQKNEREQNKLIGQLLVNQDENQSWTDEKLKFNVKQLQKMIESVASPTRKEFQIPADQWLDLSLDAGGFVRRIGRGRFHLLLKSLIWNVLYEQFFSAPFGFGALGSGEGASTLLRFLSAWRSLIEEGSVSSQFNCCSSNESTDNVEASDEGDVFSPFRTERLSNQWRTATFQNISAGAMASKFDDLGTGSSVAKLFEHNVEDTVGRIMTLLVQISSLSNSDLPSDIEKDVYKIAMLAAEIGLQFGIHPAQLVLKIPVRGEQVQIGPEVHDCEDGDRNAGSRFPVDLVVVPGLQKVGDGRADLASMRVIVPCEIYPVRA